MAKQIADMHTWLLDNQDRIYRYVIYKKIYTPYEQQQAYIDETEYEDGGNYNFCKIEEAIDLGSGNWLLGMRAIDEDGEVMKSVNYVRLDEIRLVYFENDQDIELY